MRTIMAWMLLCGLCVGQEPAGLEPVELLREYRDLSYKHAFGSVRSDCTEGLPDSELKAMRRRLDVMEAELLRRLDQHEVAQRVQKHVPPGWTRDVNVFADGWTTEIIRGPRNNPPTVWINPVTPFRRDGNFILPNMSAGKPNHERVVLLKKSSRGS